MALEKNITGMPARQKAIMAAVVIIFLIVIWQVVGLMGWGSGSSTTTTTTTTTTKATTNPAMTHSTPMPSNGAAAGTPAPTSPAAANTNPANPQQPPELKQAQVMNDPQFAQQQQMNEQKYIGKINDLEDLKLQRAIAETNQAIATAKLATVTAEKNISDLLTKPAAPEVPAGTYANKLANPGMQGEGGNAPAAASTQVEYTVISVSMQLGRWSAIIGSQGKLYSVTTGDILTPDNSVVTRINKNGVTLRKNGTSRKVSIMTAM